MKRMDIKRLRPYLLAFFLLLIGVNLSLVTVYNISSAKIEAHVAQGLAVIEKEGEYFNLFPRVSERPRISDAFQLELYTDRHMLRRLLPEDQSLSPWFAALEMNNYTRYWHGYTIILRPLMAVFNYSQIRLINIFLLFGLTVASTIFLTRYLNIYAALSLLVSLICIKVFIVPLCLAFCNMFYVFYTFLFLMLFLAKWQGKALFGSQSFSLFIFSLGIITSFMDLLSTPLLPVGLLISVACIWDYEKYEALPNPLEILRTFLAWSIGYAAMWLAKWILATLFLGKNILLDAAKALIFRIHGETARVKVDALLSLKYNLLCALSPFNALCVLLIAGIIIMFLVLLLMRGKISFNMSFFDSYKLYLSLLFIGCAPFVWVLVIANHSQIHFWFTYRIFCIPLFSVFYIFFKSINFPAISLNFNHSLMNANEKWTA